MAGGSMSIYGVENLIDTGPEGAAVQPLSGTIIRKISTRQAEIPFHTPFFSIPKFRIISSLLITGTVSRSVFYRP